MCDAAEICLNATEAIHAKGEVQLCRGLPGVLSGAPTVSHGGGLRTRQEKLFALYVSQLLQQCSNLSHCIDILNHFLRYV